MTQEWVDKMNSKYKDKISKQIEDLKDYISSSKVFTPEGKSKYLSTLNRVSLKTKDILFLKLNFMSMIDDSIYSQENYAEIIDQLISRIDSSLEELDQFCRYGKNRYERFLDSPRQHFEGSIIITDPCYIVKDRDETTRPQWSQFLQYSSMRDYPDYNKKINSSPEFRADYTRYNKACQVWDSEHPDDWSICDYGNDMNRLGIHTFMTRDTIYGDWSCTTYNSDTRKEIGSFCADAGLVSVFLLDEVLKYNPEFNYHIERPWTTTLIQDFKGDVHFEVINTSSNKESEDPFNYEVRVVGQGINMRTGEPLNFVTTQTGL